MKYECPCGYVYDPAVGDPDGGIAPGTAFEDIPEDWVCPICGLGKDAFVEAPAQHLRIFPRIGFAPSAVSAKTLLLKHN